MKTLIILRKFFYISQKNSETTDFSTFIYEPIIIKNSMNANIKKPQILYFMIYDLKGHKRSHKVILKIQNSSFSAIFFLFIAKSFKNFLRMSIFMTTQILYKMKYELIGHPRS